VPNSITEILEAEKLMLSASICNFVEKLPTEVALSICDYYFQVQKNGTASIHVPQNRTLTASEIYFFTPASWLDCNGTKYYLYFGGTQENDVLKKIQHRALMF
jgi:hypothetical protein